MAARLLVERTYYSRFVAYDIAVFKEFCSSDTLALDIGANKGDLTLFLALYALHVHAFEPEPSMAEDMRRRFQGTNVTVHECALGRKSRNAVLKVPTFGTEVYTTRGTFLDDLDGMTVGGHSISKIREVAVPVKSLDDFRFQNVGFIKIDVEGYELEVLQGAHRTIRNSSPILYVEIEQRRHPGHDISDIFRQIEALGFRGFFYHSGKFRPVEEFNAVTMQDQAWEGTPGFINNFLFTPHSHQISL